MGVEKLEPKRFDLMYQINTRAVMVCSQAALPYLKESRGHILSLSPPLNLDAKWFAQHGPYTVTKYGMSMLTLGMAEEFKKYRHQRQFAVAKDDDRHRRHRVRSWAAATRSSVHARRRSWPTRPMRS